LLNVAVTLRGEVLAAGDTFSAVLCLAWLGDDQ